MHMLRVSLMELCPFPQPFHVTGRKIKTNFWKILSPLLCYSSMTSYGKIKVNIHASLTLQSVEPGISVCLYVDPPAAVENGGWGGP